MLSRRTYAVDPATMKIQNRLARKSRKRRVTIDNFGGFALIHPHYNCIVAGERFDMSADDVVEFCEN
jgi:hypothetical protein